MENYACGFNQSETGKYFEWIIKNINVFHNSMLYSPNLWYQLAKFPLSRKVFEHVERKNLVSPYLLFNLLSGYNGPFFSSWLTKNPYIDSCLKPFYNGHFLLSPRWPLWRGSTVLLLPIVMTFKITEWFFKVLKLKRIMVIFSAFTSKITGEHSLIYYLCLGCVINYCWSTH